MLKTSPPYSPIGMLMEFFELCKLKFYSPCLDSSMIIWSSYTKFPLGLFPICDAILEVLPSNPLGLSQTPASNKTPPGTPRQTPSKNNLDPHRGSDSSQLKHGIWTVRFARFFAVGITLLTAISFPKFTAVIGFCSWIFAPSLMAAIPIACYLRLFPEDASISPLRRRFHQVAVVGSIAASIIGMALPLLDALWS